MTTMTRFFIDTNTREVRAEFNDRQTLHLEYDNLEEITAFIGSYYSENGKVIDHYELYLKLVPFTVADKPVYL